MLTASASTPNTRQSSARSTPTPDNWFGVSAGMNAAKEAITGGDFEKAEQILIEMLEFAPSETAGWKLLARVQRRLGHIDAGIRSAERALQLQNASSRVGPAASATLAKLLWQQGERAQAREMLDLLLTSRPEDHSLSLLKSAWDEESGA